MESTPRVTEAASDSHGSSSDEPEIVPEMDSNFHKDAVTGGNKTLDGQQELESILLTPNKNAILGVNIIALQKVEDEKSTKFLKEMLGLNNITSQKEKKLTNFVQEMLGKCPSLLLQVNATRVEDLIELSENYKVQENGTGDVISCPPEITARVRDRATADMLQKDAVEGKTEKFKGKEIDHLVTPNKNTILHIHFMALQKEEEKSINFVLDVLGKSPSLLLQANAKGNTPLHVVAANGLSKMVETLIEFAKSQHKELEGGAGEARTMLGMPNKEGNTALHEAALQGYRDVVEKLIRAEPDLPYSANHSGETPLYIAALRGKNDVVCQILSNSSIDVADEGPNGKTALHAAVRIDNSGITRRILKKKKQLREKIDHYGWTPLHYAAYYDCSEVVSHLLKDEDGSATSAAYIGDKERGMTPLHLAAAQGHKEIMYKIISECPYCYELADKRGWNVLHFAMLSLDYKALNSFLEDPLRRSLLYEKDVKGNTPLHLLASSFTNSNLCKILVKNGDRFALNKENICPADIVNGSSADDLKVTVVNDESHMKDIKELLDKVDQPYTNGVICKRRNVSEKQISRIKDAKESHIVVAALVATVTFAAGFTLPGGYNEEGGAILSRRTAFQAFVIVDAIAMLLSVSAIFVYYLISLDRFVKHLFLFNFAFWLTLSSTALMVVAFGAGIYAVLPTWYGILAACIGLCFFPIAIILRILALRW